MAPWQDIEGCEYQLLEHVLPALRAPPQGGGRVELLAVEWHPPPAGPPPPAAGGGGGVGASPEQHPAVRYSRLLEGPSYNVTTLAWV